MPQISFVSINQVLINALTGQVDFIFGGDPGVSDSAPKRGTTTRNGAALGSRSTGFGDGREFDEIRDGSHELFSPAKIKMEGDGVSVFRSELSWNVFGNM